MNTVDILLLLVGAFCGILAEVIVKDFTAHRKEKTLKQIARDAELIHLRTRVRDLESMLPQKETL